MLNCSRILVTVVVVAALPAATLQQLSLGEMAKKATAVVRARVTSSSARLTGSTVYTHYKLAVKESWKGRSPAEVLVPGGVASGFQQTFPGAPALEVNREYVLFLWTSPKGLTQVMGLTQGLFLVDGEKAVRPESGELMLDASGNEVADQTITTTLALLRAEVKRR